MIESIRKRPGMYVGGTDLFGLINYLVCPFNLLLSQNARQIDVIVDQARFQIQSDAQLRIEQQTEGLIPFEHFAKGPGHGFEGPVLAALSEHLTIRVATEKEIWSLSYELGQRTSLEIHQNSGEAISTDLNFVPDPSIFSAGNISHFIFDSYLRRISHLYPGVRFRLTVAGTTTEYYSANGIRDMFQSFSAPFQLLHQPVHIQASSGTLRLELVFAFHSWSRDWILPFINNGRAAEGGTHETGLMAAFNKLTKSLTGKKFRNGIIAILSIIYPEVVWEGCIKKEITDEKLHNIVRDLVVENTMTWVKSRPDVADQLTKLQIFQFPELWYD